MNLFWREMKANRKSMIIWIIGIAAMVGSGMSKYAGMSESGEAMNALLANMPKAMQAIMGVGALDISTPVGYYGMLFLYLLLMAAVHASMLGANIVAKEERDKTSEFLLAKPISRRSMLSFKMLAAFVLVLIFNAVMLLFSVAFVAPYADGGAGEVTGDIMRLMLGLLLAQLFFLSVGMAIASAGRNPKRAVPLSAAVMLLTFLLSITIDISGGLTYLSYLTPFKYVEASGVINDGFNPIYVGCSLVVTAAAIAISFAGYAQRDMRV